MQTSTLECCVWSTKSCLCSVLLQSEDKPSPALFCCCSFLFPAGPKDLLSDRCILSCPSMDLVTCLLDFRLNFASNRSIVPRLAASLAACAQLSALGEYSLKIRSFFLKLG